MTPCASRLWMRSETVVVLVTASLRREVKNMKLRDESFMHQFRSRMRAVSIDEARGTLYLAEKEAINMMNSSWSTNAKNTWLIQHTPRALFWQQHAGSWPDSTSYLPNISSNSRQKVYARRCCCCRLIWKTSGEAKVQSTSSRGTRQTGCRQLLFTHKVTSTNNTVF